MARRLVAGMLVVVSLALLTVYLREDDEGALHGAQQLGLAVLTPFQVAGERIARPFQDAYGYVSDLVDAKAERDALEAQLQALRDELVLYQTAAEENQQPPRDARVRRRAPLPRGLHAGHDARHRPTADTVRPAAPRGRGLGRRGRAERSGRHGRRARREGDQGLVRRLAGHAPHRPVDRRLRGRSPNAGARRDRAGSRRAAAGSSSTGWTRRRRSRSATRS